VPTGIDYLSLSRPGGGQLSGERVEFAALPPTRGEL